MLPSLKPPKSDYNGNEEEEFHDLLQNAIDQTPKKDILFVQGDWNAKVGKDAHGNWQGICKPFCNDETNKKGLRLLEFATFNDPVLANTLGHHKVSRNEDGPGTALTDNTTTRLLTF